MDHHELLNGSRIEGTPALPVVVVTLLKGVLYQD